MLKLLSYFCVGLILDVLAVIDLKAVQHDYSLLSAIATLIMTFLSYGILAEIIPSSDRKKELFFFSLGGAIGAYVMLEWGIL